MRTSAFEAQGSGVGIGGTDAKIGSALVVVIATMRLPLRLSRRRDPVMASGIRLGEFLALGVTQDDGQQRRPGWFGQ
jgi:hypothetical protein